MMRLLFLMIPLLLLPAVSYGDDWATFQLYPEAKEVQSFSLFDGNAHELYFETELAYPSTDVIDFYSKQITGQWIACTSEFEAWQKFGDVSDKTPKYIHQIRRYWANFKRNRLLLLAIRYYSAGSECRDKPDNKTQHVFLTEYKEDLQQATSLLKIECESKMSRNTNKSRREGR